MRAICLSAEPQKKTKRKMVITGLKRNQKYKAKIDGIIIGNRYEATKELSINKFSNAIKKQVEIEHKVKSICHNVSTIYLPYYIIFAKEINKKRNWTERNILYNKWGQRGLNWYLLLEIEKYIFGMSPELRTINPDPTRNLHNPFYEDQGNLARDVSGNGCNCIMNGGTWLKGKVGNAMYFNGTGDKGNVADNPSINFGIGNFSLMTWIKIETGSVNWARIITKYDNLKGFLIRKYINENMIFNLQGAGDGALTGFDGAGMLIPITNEWAHCCWTISRVGNNCTIKVYLNGIYKSQQTKTIIGTITNSTALKYWNTYNKSGTLDEIMLYNRILTDTEILEYYNLTKNYGND